MKRERGLALAACVILAALILLFTSQSSPLYPINLWGDANCLFTVGRVMKDGGVLYRDIYEQKGPLIYLIHALAACISDTSFLGVYMMEIPALAAALYAAYRLMRLRAGRAFSLSAAAFFGAAFASCTAFIRGDSAEEFCLPLLMTALAMAYAEYGRRAKPMRLKRLLACGVLAGCIATIKYTQLGALVGLCAVEGVLALKEGGLPRALQSAGVFLIGMAIPILPWVIYFAANGALSDAYTAYLYNNIFLYGGEAQTWGERLNQWGQYAAANACWVIPAAAGLIALAFDRGETPAVRLCVWAMAVGQFAAVFLAGRVWPYSILGMAAFAVIGLMQLHRLWGKRTLSPRVQKGLTAAVCAASLIGAAFTTPNAFLRGEDIGNLAQGMFADYVEPGKTMLQYSYLDGGVYLVTGTRPAGKFFARLNVNLDEMNEEMDRYLREGIPDYVVVDWNRLPAEFDRYEEICALTSYDDSNRYIKSMILYRRKTDE